MRNYESGRGHFKFPPWWWCVLKSQTRSQVTTTHHQPYNMPAMEEVNKKPEQWGGESEQYNISWIYVAELEYTINGDKTESSSTKT